MAKGDKKRKEKWLQKRHSFLRKTGSKGKPFQRLLIVCEGEKTEPDYFRQFKVPSADIKIVGTGYNTMTLVKEALKLKKAAKDNDEPYDQVWCVFDRDAFPTPDVNNAWHTARKKKLRTALSNEAFELWFLLHFDYIIAAHTRYQYQEMLSERLGREYRKNDSDMYHELLSRQSIAIGNAKKLISQYDPRKPATDNPCTEVHELVMELNNHR